VKLVSYAIELSLIVSQKQYTAFMCGETVHTVRQFSISSDKVHNMCGSARETRSVADSAMCSNLQGVE
jgi:hypothetical protein